MDPFDRAREAMWGTPGFQVRRSTVVSPGSSFMPQASYILETCRNTEGWLILLQSVSEEGGQRIVLPNRVAQAIFRHYEAIMTQARKDRAVKAAESRALKAVLKDVREAKKES